MGKLAQNFAKYLVQAKMSATGIVEKPDIIGAIFGQTEGLLGSELDLRELQRTGRIGRIEVNVRNFQGRSTAEISIPSSLDASETALIAASLETIDKVGPCDATIEVVKVEDVRTQKRRYVIDRAKDILRVLHQEFSDSHSLAEQIREAVRTCEASTWEGLSCGPDISTSDEIIVVEGRADVINLLRNGIRNCIAIEGSKIPDAIIKLTKEKSVTALLDGDRGGDLILKKLTEVADIDFVARADAGLEVEELTKKQIFKSLRDRIPIDQALQQGRQVQSIVNHTDHIEKDRQTFGEIDMENFMRLGEEILGTRAAFIIDNNGSVMSKVPLGEMSILLTDYPEAYALVVDSKIGQDLVDLAIRHRIRYLVGTGYRDKIRSTPETKVITLDEIKTPAMKTTNNEKAPTYQQLR